VVGGTDYWAMIVQAHEIHHTGITRHSRLAISAFTRAAFRRAELGKSQQDVARDVGTTRQHYSAIERGLHVPTPRTALAIARALECEPQEIFPINVSGATATAAPDETADVTGRRGSG
jgi:transcriptional regulator with XRE-family HTH domain